MSSSSKIQAVAASVAMALAALMPGGFMLDAWVFGVALGIGQSLIGLHYYRAALASPSLKFGPALASGFIRIGILLLALAAILRLGCPAPPFVWALLSSYAAMMAAELAIVARLVRNPATEAR